VYEGMHLLIALTPASSGYIHGSSQMRMTLLGTGFVGMNFKDDLTMYAYIVSRNPGCVPELCTHQPKLHSVWKARCHTCTRFRDFHA
jgi:hypothetical protein